jgi:hypothetical protein
VAIDDIILKMLSLHKGGKPHVQIRRCKKSREEKAPENSERKEAGQKGKEEEQIARQSRYSLALEKWRCPPLVEGWFSLSQPRQQWL